MTKRISLPAGWRLEARDVVDSTNVLAKTFVDGNVVVWAEEQTAGRGRFSRVWHSPRGNLYCSLVMSPVGADLTRYSFLTALALRETFVGLKSDLPVRCKWPNDVLIGGKKASGILLELTGTPEKPRLIVGVGVNVVSHPDAANVMYAATSLKNEGVKTDAATVLERFVYNFSVWSERPMSRILEDFSKNAYALGTRITVSLPDEKVEGVFTGLDCDGALLLTTNETTRRIMAGDVFYSHKEKE